MPAPHSVALIGFSPFERNTLAAYFRLATHRSPCYTAVQLLSEPHFMVADADHDPSVQLALAEDMLSRTVFIGAQAPPGATAWMRRPIDPLHVMRELDAMVAQMSARATAPAVGEAPATPAVEAEPPAATATPATFAAPAFTDPHGDDQLTLIFSRPDPTQQAEPGTPADTAPTVHGQPTVALPRRFRRATIEEAFEGDGSSLPQVPALALPPRAPPQPVPALPPPRALLVDDSELARHFLSRLLEPWGVVCDQAPLSQHALQNLAERDYDFIFLDLELGIDSAMDGLALCQHIKRQHANVQAALATVVMVSAHHSETDRARGSLAGCDAYLGKPLKQDELRQLLLRQGLKPLDGSLTRPTRTRTGTPAG